MQPDFRFFILREQIPRPGQSVSRGLVTCHEEHRSLVADRRRIETAFFGGHATHQRSFSIVRSGHYPSKQSIDHRLDAGGATADAPPMQPRQEIWEPE